MTALVLLAAATVFVLVLVQLVRCRDANTQRAVERLALLNQVGTALASELEEERLLHLIAQTACTLTGASFAAFTLRPVDELGRPTGPSEGQLFHLAAVVGVTEEQERLFQRMPLGGEGLLAPIFCQGVPVRVADALDHLTLDKQTSHALARQAAFDYAHGSLGKDGLRGLGVPHGHPVVRSFLGVPLLDRNKEVRGGLLLGHAEPSKFTREHEQVLVGLASQASVALENARLHHITQMRAQELHAIFESIADAVILVDADGKVVRENRAAHCVRERIQGSPEDGQIMRALLHAPAQQALTGAGSQHVTVCVTDVQNEQREYRVSASPLRSLQADHLSPQQKRATMSNGISGVVVTWHDVTEERRLAQERRINAALKEAEQLKDDFIGIAAHELRTPLAVLKGFAQMLLMQSERGKGPALVDWQIEALQGIDQATHRLVELTEDLLDVTRLQAGRLTLHPTPTDLVALTRRVIKRLQLTTEKHTLSFAPVMEHLVVDVDPQRMEQVLSNLLGNAIKYSPHGGPIDITMQEDAAEHMAEVSICDHGIGIPIEQQAEVFGRFVRADNARMCGIGGTGLGLYLCRELIERQGGRIWFASIEGAGSTFSVALPVYVSN
jgi:signal transduction histidine kinase